MITHNNNDGVKTFLQRPIFSCLIYDTRLQLYSFLPFSDGWDTDSDIAFLSSTVDISFPLLISFLSPHSRPFISSVLLYSFSFPQSFSSISLCSLCPSLSVTLWIFASLLRNATQGTRALQSILQTSWPLEDSLQMPRDNMTGWHLKKEGGGDRERERDGPRNTYCYQRCSDLRGGGYDWEEKKRTRTRMREEEI